MKLFSILGLLMGLHIGVHAQAVEECRNYDLNIESQNSTQFEKCSAAAGTCDCKNPADLITICHRNWSSCSESYYCGGECKIECEQSDGSTTTGSVGCATGGEGSDGVPTTCSCAGSQIPEHCYVTSEQCARDPSKACDGKCSWSCKDIFGQEWDTTTSCRF